MGELTGGYLKGELSEKEYAKRIESVQRFERQLTDNGYLVVKLFLNISRKEQERRIRHLAGEKDTAWRVGSYDLWQHEHYDRCRDIFSDYLNRPISRQRPGISLTQSPESGESFRLWRS